MIDILYMSWQYLRYHRLKTTILVVAIGVIVFIPAALQVLVREAELQLTTRARATPLLLGTKDSPLELAISSLYFSGARQDAIEFAQVSAIRETELAQAIPLHVRFHSRHDPIVGTTLDYFEFRGLRVADGRLMARLGDCTVGAEVAHRRQLKPGDHLLSAPESAFRLAAGYPLKLRVTGVFAPSHGPDDGAIFVDVKTAWIIEGLAHGHQDLASTDAEQTVLRREGDTVIANASVRQYQEITDENVGTFHFHGDPSTFPISAVIALPPDHKSKTLLLGRYQASEKFRLIEPTDVIDELLATVFAVQSLVAASLAIVGFAALVLLALVFLLSLRLRRSEIETMIKIGVARRRLAAILASEIVTVLGSGCLLAACAALVIQRFGPSLIRTLLMA